MVLCPPFKWASKGGFNLATPVRERDDSVQRRETIVFVSVGVQTEPTSFVRFHSLNAICHDNKITQLCKSENSINKTKENTIEYWILISYYKLMQI